jgi:hypothetical protein
MGHSWIVGVLDDLRTYAELNGLERLAASLAGTALVAEELAAQEAPEGASLDWADELIQDALQGSLQVAVRAAPQVAFKGSASARARRDRDELGPRLGADRGGAGAS